MADNATITALARALHLAAAMSLLGTVGFLAVMLPAASLVPDKLLRRLTCLWWGSGMVVLLAGSVWFLLESAAIAGAEDVTEVWAALPVVALHTRFGNVLMVRLGLLLAATLAALAAGRPVEQAAAGRNPRRLAAYPAIVLIAGALGLQGLIGHAGAIKGTTGDGLLLSESLHLLAAGLWLGALPALWLSVRMLPAASGLQVCGRFSPIGLACVLILAGTGTMQALQFTGGWPSLFGTLYGHIELLKIALFLLALTLAAVNRLWLTDRLSQDPGGRGHLLLSISVETVIGLAIVVAAVFLASSVPGVRQASISPLSWRFGLVLTAGC